MARQKLAAARAAGKDRLAAMRKVASRFANLKPATEALTRIRSVPTCFIQLDHALGIGGFPIERFSVVHGPSGMGKTSLVLGLVKSFLARDHFACFIDAERTTAIDWVSDMVSDELAAHPGFVGKRPDTYEETIADVRNFCLTIAEAKDKGELSEDTSGIIVVDSIKKLVPKNMWAEIMKDGGGETDLLKRIGQIKAGMNSLWLDELVPILEKGGVGMVAIAREMEEAQQKRGKFMIGPGYKVGGGQAVNYDASARIRVERAGYISDEKEGDGEERSGRYYGERLRATIHKTKLAWRDEKTVRCYFHTSNGLWVPRGFDRARDVLELAERFKVVEKKGAWFSHGEERLGQGQHNAVKVLSGNAEWLDRIERECRQKFEINAPLEADDAAKDEA